MLYIIILLVCVLLRIRSGFAVALFVSCNAISTALQNTILKYTYGTVDLIDIIFALLKLFDVPTRP
jgi:hypothetical protein